MITIKYGYCLHVHRTGNVNYNIGLITISNNHMYTNIKLSLIQWRVYMIVQILLHIHDKLLIILREVWSYFIKF